MTTDLNFYLGTTLNHYEYMHIPIKYTSTNIMKQYNTASLVHKDHVVVEI